MIEPLERKPFKLSREQTDALEALADDMAFLDTEIARMERAGIDVAKMKEDFEKAKQMRSGLLREFGA